jgi:hypothetical protein
MCAQRAAQIIQWLGLAKNETVGAPTYFTRRPLSETRTPESFVRAYDFFMRIPVS